MDNLIKQLVNKSDIDKNEFYSYRQHNKNSVNFINNDKTDKKIFYNMISEPIFVDYVVFDFETTGFNPLKNKIIEIGAIKVLNSKIIKGFNELVNPEVKIPKHISEKVNIYDDMVKNCRTINEVLPDFLKFIGDDVLVAHNSGFDMKFLIYNAQNIGINYIKNDVLNTLSLSRRYLKETKKHNLKDLCEFFGIENKNAHRAYSDVLATNEIYKIIQKRYI